MSRPPRQAGGGPTQAPADERTWKSSSEETAFKQMSELEKFVNDLPELQRHAFEDEILRRVQEDRKWRKVHDKFPERMPAMTTYANNAFERSCGDRLPRAPSRSGVNGVRRIPSQRGRSWPRRP